MRPGEAGPQEAASLVVADARLADGRAVDVAIAAGRIAAVRPAGTAATDAAKRIDARGALVSPSFVEGHIHLDKTLLGLPLLRQRPGGTVAERIAAEKRLRPTLALSVEERGGRLVEQVTRFGTGAIRTHVDIDADVELAGLEQVLRIRDRYRERVSIEIVAFPQSGILHEPGAADLLDAALRAGADLVGGLDPAGIDGDVEGHLAVVFGLAERHGKGIDIHLHDAGALGAFELRQIAARTRAAGLEGRVAVSHAYALGAVDEVEFGRTAEALARSGVAIMTNAPGTGTMPPVLRLAQAGVTVFAGSDNIRDGWWPYGNGDMLDRAHVIGYRQGLYTHDDLAYAFAMTTEHGAKVMRLEGYGGGVGDVADLVLIPSGSVAEAVLDRPQDRIVIKRGEVVAQGNRLP